MNFLFLGVRQLSSNSPDPVFLVLFESLMIQLKWEMVDFPPNISWWKNFTVHLPAEHSLPVRLGKRCFHSCNIQLLMPWVVLVPCVLPGKTLRRFGMMVRYGIFYFSTVTEPVLWEDKDMCPHCPTTTTSCQRPALNDSLITFNSSFFIQLELHRVRKTMNSIHLSHLQGVVCIIIRSL